MHFKSGHRFILGFTIAASLLGSGIMNIHADQQAPIDATQYYIQANQIKVVNGNYLYHDLAFSTDQRGAYIAPVTVLKVNQIIQANGNRAVFSVTYQGQNYYFSAYKYYSTVIAGGPTVPAAMIDTNNYYPKATQIRVINGNYLYNDVAFSADQRGAYIAPGTILTVNGVIPTNTSRAVLNVTYNGQVYYFSDYKYYSVVTAGGVTVGPTPQPQQPTTPVQAVTQEQRVLNAWQQINYNGAAKVSMALYNNKTGKTVVYTPRGTASGFYNASIVKLSILTQYLRNNNMSYNSLAYMNAVNMITHSDNNAATYLYNLDGGPQGLQNFYNWMGMSSSTANLYRYWGLNTTSATDQLNLLNAIYYRGNILTPAKLGIIKNLMSQVESDQQWGVGNVTGANVQVKNGWLPLGNGYTNAVINSLGHIQNTKVDYTLAILTNGNTMQFTGINLANQIGAAAYRALNQ